MRLYKLGGFLSHIWQSTLATAYKRKFRQAVALPLTISFVDARGKWDVLDARSWSEQRLSLSELRVFATAGVRAMGRAQRPAKRHDYSPVSG